MTDRLTPAQRHLVMSHVHSRNTKPELKVRQWLWNHGYRYRLNVKGVPGKPDIVMRRYHTAIFVNGCFWHGHGVSLPSLYQKHKPFIYRQSKEGSHLPMAAEESQYEE